MNRVLFLVIILFCFGCATFSSEDDWKEGDLNRDEQYKVSADDMLTPIVMNKMKEAIELVQRKGEYNPNARDQDGNTLLHWASYQADANLVKALISAGANPRMKNKEGLNPLHFSHKYRHFKIKVTCLLNGESSGGIDAVYRNFTEAERLETSKILLNAGVKIDAKDDSGNTALYYAVYDYPRINVLKLLLDSGADINASNNQGESVLMNYIDSGESNIEILNLFVQNGININHRDNEGKNILSKVVEKNNYTLFKYLIEKGANPKNIDKKGRTLLYSFIDFRDEKNDFRIANHFANLGLPLTEKFTEEEAVLKIIAKQNSDLLKIFLSASKNPKSDIDSTKALLTSVENEKSLNLILQYNPDVNVSDQFNRNVLFYLFELNIRGEKEKFAVKYLNEFIKRGINVNARDTNDGQTPIWRAIYHQCESCIPILLKANADTNTADNVGETFLNFIERTDKNEGRNLKRYFKK